MTGGSPRRLYGTEEPTDAALDRIAGGDQAAFRELYERYRRLVFAVARSVVEDALLAEEVCQDTFVRVFTSLAGFQRGTRFTAWIATVARNLALNALSSRKGRKREVGLRADLPAAAQAPDELPELLAGLSPEERVLVVLRYTEGLSYEEIAGAMNKAPGTLRNLMSQALRRLRTLAQKEGRR